MWRQKFKNIFRSIVPRWLLCGVRAGWILVKYRGQVKTDSNGLIVDKQDAHIPWITYPAMDFLRSWDLSGLDVFEFGSGSSTLFWLEQGAKVTSVDHDSMWQKRVQEILGSRAHVEYRDENSYANYINEVGKKFDVVMIDGARRYNSAHEALKHLKLGALLILDNSEWYPGACKMLRDHGFTQIDFEGFTPITSFPSVTSVFHREPIRFKYKPKNNRWVPLGAVPFPNVIDDYLM
ncbi:MAG: class I SAM-dependent methyltransferase [Bdellovibrionales bacterium]|nr:class I SAM-dependent methyltransferase [Bdellovibrionales bacterium]